MRYGRLRPSGGIAKQRYISWDVADAEAMANDICAICFKDSMGQSRRSATHLIHAMCGCGRHETKFCDTHTREFANVLESTCGTCRQARVFSEPMRLRRDEPQPPRTSDPPDPSGPDKSYLGEEADQWLA